MVIPRNPLASPRTYDQNAARLFASQLICYSEDDVRRAIARAATPGNAAAQQALGLEIILRGRIRATRPFVIPAAAKGLVVRSTGASAISAAGEMARVFDVFADDVQFADLRIVANNTNGFAGFVRSDLSDPSIDNGHTTIDGCSFNASRTVAGVFYESVESGDAGSRITNNFTQQTGASTFITLEGQQAIIGGNTVFDCAVFLSVGATSGLNRIHGNQCGAGTINTSTGIGQNTIVGNIGAGTITNHITDHVGLNT